MEQYMPQNQMTTELAPHESTTISQLCDGDHINRNSMRKWYTYEDVLRIEAQIKKAAQVSG